MDKKNLENMVPFFKLKCCFSYFVFVICFQQCWTAKIFDSLANLSKISYSRPDIVLEWTRELYFPGNFEIKWFSNDSSWLIMEMSGETEGYVSVGFSPNGVMQGSDIVLGWVDSKGIPHLKDMYAVGNITPIEDTENNYELILAHQTNGRTTIRFRRRWETCDTRHDYDITGATMRLIYAWHEHDPFLSREILLPKYHGPNSRGVQSVYLRSVTQMDKFPDQTNSPNPSIQVWDLQIGNVTVISKESPHYCQIAKAPHRHNKISRIIGFRPLVEFRHKEWVHQMKLYECNIPSELQDIKQTFDKFLNVPGKLCYSQPFPQDWLTYCVLTPVMWSTGAEGLMLPHQNGIPLKNKQTTYFMLEIHYSNPELLNLVRDNSGLQIYLTEESKNYDTAIMTIGNTNSPLHIIPPRSTKFTTIGYCVSECTKQTIPPDGITVTHAMLSGNYALRKISLRHIRHGNELPPITHDNRYDFHYKQFRAVEPERKVLPGDILMAECEYNTSWNEDITFGGLSDTDETCLVHIYYYPKVNLSDCRVQLQFNSFINAIGIREVKGDSLDQIDSSSETYPGGSVYQSPGENVHNSSIFDRIQIIKPIPIDENGLTMDVYLQSLDWQGNKEKLTRHVEEKWLKGKRLAICTGTGNKHIPIKEHIVPYPKFLKYIPKTNNKCRENNTRKGTINRQYPRVRNYGYFH